MERNFSPRPVVIGQEAMASNGKRVDLDIRKKFVFNECCETMPQVVQRSCVYSTLQVFRTRVDRALSKLV